MVLSWPLNGELDGRHAVTSLNIGPATVASRDSVPAPEIFVMRSKMSSGSSGDFGKGDVGGVLDGIEDGGGRGRPWGARRCLLHRRRPWGEGISSKVTWMGGDVCAGGHDVVGHLVVGECGRCARGTSRRGRKPMPCATPPSIWPAARIGWRTLPTSCRGVEVGDAGGIRGGVDGDFGDVDCPGVGGIGFACR